MFTSAGFENKESLNYEDFKTMMKEFKGDFLAIGLDCKGAKQNYLDSTTNVARMQSFGLGKPKNYVKLEKKIWDYLRNYLIFFCFIF